MSSTCTLLNSPSPTASSPRQAIRTDEADLFHKYSPRRSTAPFKQPSQLKPTSKWKAVLALLAPPRLLLPDPVKPANPSINIPLRPPPASSAALSSSSALASDLPLGFSPIDTDTSLSAGSSVDSHVPLGAQLTSTDTPVAIADNNPVAIADNNPPAFCDSFPFSLDVANYVEKLLHILPLPDDINKRTLALSALCALCVSSPSNANRCVVAGGVEIIMDTLNSTTQPSAQPSHSAAAIVLEESEKALLLLQVLTSISEEGCIAALQHASSIITTLGKKLLRVSESCTASAIAVLTALCRRSEAALFRNAVSESAIPSKLVVVLQVASKDSTKRRAGRLLRLLAEQPPQHTVSS